MWTASKILTDMLHAFNRKITRSSALPASDELYYLQSRSGTHWCFVPFRPPDNAPVQLHRHAIRGYFEPCQNLGQRPAFRNQAILSVYNNLYLFCSYFRHAFFWRTGNRRL